MSTPPQAGEFCWNELMTSDTAQAKDFYGKLFGWTSQDFPMEHTTYTMLFQGEQPVAGMLPIPPQGVGTIPPHWMSYVLVSNLDEMVTKAKGLGAIVKVPPTQAGEFGRFSVIADPAGAIFSLWEPTPK